MLVLRALYTVCSVTRRNTANCVERVPVSVGGQLTGKPVPVGGKMVLVHHKFAVSVGVNSLPTGAVALLFKNLIIFLNELSYYIPIPVTMGNTKKHLANYFSLLLSLFCALAKNNILLLV